MSSFWLLKSEPETFSWQQLQKDGKAMWDGVRNYQAANNLKAMRKDDLGFALGVETVLHAVCLVDQRFDRQRDQRDDMAADQRVNDDLLGCSCGFCKGGEHGGCLRVFRR